MQNHSQSNKCSIISYFEMTKKKDLGLITFNPTIYKFLRIIGWTKTEKKILDCGAGGETPPLALFNHHGN